MTALLSSVSTIGSHETSYTLSTELQGTLFILTNPEAHSYVYL